MPQATGEKRTGAGANRIRELIAGEIEERPTRQR